MFRINAAQEKGPYSLLKMRLMLLDESGRKLARDALCASGLSHHTLRARLLGLGWKGIGASPQSERCTLATCNMTSNPHLPLFRASSYFTLLDDRDYLNDLKECSSVMFKAYPRMYYNVTCVGVC